MPATASWELKNYTVGELKVVGLDKEKRQGTIRIEDFKISDILCTAIEGFLASMVKMIVGNPATCQETKCQFRGDEYHEFTIKW